MAKYLGLGGLFVKDESYRFGLNAFKVLGGSFAMARYIAQQMGRDVSEMTYDYLTSEEFRREFGQATFSPPRTAIMAGAWPGRPISWDKRLWSTCPRAAAGPV